MYTSKGITNHSTVSRKDRKNVKLTVEIKHNPDLTKEDVKRVIHVKRVIQLRGQLLNNTL